MVFNGGRVWRGKYSRQSFMWQPFRGVAGFASGQQLNTVAFRVLIRGPGVPVVAYGGALTRPPWGPGV